MLLFRHFIKTSKSSFTKTLLPCIRTSLKPALSANLLTLFEKIPSSFAISEIVKFPCFRIRFQRV